MSVEGSADGDAARITRVSVYPSRVSYRKLGLAVAALIGVTYLAIQWATRPSTTSVAPPRPTLVLARQDAPASTSYDALAAPEPVPPAPVPPRPAPPPAPATTAAAPRQRDLLAEAVEKGFARPARRCDGEQGAPAGHGVPAAGGSRQRSTTATDAFEPFQATGPIVPPGTPIPAVTQSAVVTERGGVVAAMITRDVWDAGFSCLAIPAGSVLVAEYSTSVGRGQKRIDIAAPQITRPWPRHDTVQLRAMTADAQGASGLPGTVEVPWFQTGALIAASTAVDLGTAALTQGGSLVGIILGRTLESPLDRAAKDFLERQPVISLEAGTEIVVLLRGAIACDDFRSPHRTP